MLKQATCILGCGIWRLLWKSSEMEDVWLQESLEWQRELGTHMNALSELPEPGVQARSTERF